MQLHVAITLRLLSVNSDIKGGGRGSRLAVKELSFGSSNNNNTETERRPMKKVMAGIDLHSNNVVIGIMDTDGKRVASGKLPCELKEIAKFLAPFKKRLEQVAVESTYNWYWLVDGLQALKYPVVLANPAAMQQYSGIKHADDTNDAFFLAELLRLKRVLQVSMNEDAENWANLHKSGSTRSALKIHLALLRSQSPEQRAFDRRSVQERVRPQEHGGVGQQCHAPSQSQAVEKHRAQSELIFLVRLSRLNPRADLLQQSLGGQRAERQQSQQGFVNRGCVGELPRAAAGPPATRAQLCRWQWPKPMQIVPHIVAEPLQRLALLTSCLSLADEGRHQFHVGAQMRHDSHAPAFPTQAFALGRQVAHVGDHLARPPRPALITIMETGNEQKAQ